jgi:hypothetical protein
MGCGWQPLNSINEAVKKIDANILDVIENSDDMSMVSPVIFVLITYASEIYAIAVPTGVNLREARFDRGAAGRG